VPGQHVHVQNIGMGEFSKDYAYGVDAQADAELRSASDIQWHSPPGRTRGDAELYWHFTSVNCSAHVAGLVADVFKRNPFTGHDPLADYPNVDGVVALTHKTGCGDAA
jgi:altronate hydrolase